MRPRNFVLKITSLCLVILFFFVSCKKDEPEPADPVPVTPTGKYFHWQVNGGATMAADSTFASQDHVIFAYKNSGASIEVNLATLTTGTYQISSSTGNQLQYDDGATTHEGSGTFVISSADGNKLAGHFSCSLTGGNLSTITGTFSEVPKR